MRAFIQEPERSRLSRVSRRHVKVSTHILRVISLALYAGEQEPGRYTNVNALTPRPVPRL